MRADDHPDTRIKAADAKWVYESEDPMGRLAMIGDRRGFRAVAAIKVDQQSPMTPWAIAWGYATDDCEVMDSYAKGLAQHCAPQFSAAKGMVLLGVHEDGIAEVATYGETVNDCKRLGTWGGVILEQLPACPFQTWFGWGNGGVPKPLSEAEVARLTPNQRAYVERFTLPA